MTIIPPWRYHHHHLLQELRLLPRPFRVQCVCQSWRSGFLRQRLRLGANGTVSAFGNSSYARCLLPRHTPSQARAQSFRKRRSLGSGATPSLRGTGMSCTRLLLLPDARARCMPSSSHREQRAHADRLREGGGGGWPAFKQETKQKSGSDVQNNKLKTLPTRQLRRASSVCVGFDSFE